MCVAEEGLVHQVVMSIYLVWRENAGREMAGFVNGKVLVACGNAHGLVAKLG